MKSPADTGRSETVRFPPGFLWGAATSSHQVEGDNRWNDWWQAECAGQVPHRSGAACEHFQRYRADFDMARDWGHTAHRISIEWSRIEPEPGAWNDAALDHYTAVVDALRERGIEPIVTLHHFTNPVWFTARGGWSSAGSVALFRRFVEVVLARLGDRVRYWITINEPTVYVKRSYVAGSWPPGERRSWRHAVMVLNNMCRAHRAAYTAIHGARTDAMVGIAHSAPSVEAVDPGRFADRCVALLRDVVLNRLLFWWLRGLSGLKLDFIGLNYYARELVRWDTKGLGWLFGSENREPHQGRARHYSSLGWEIHAPGLTQVLRQFSRYKLPLLVTENGIATDDEVQRSEYLKSHLDALAIAVSEGIDVRGYCYWSLLDNFEWAEGYAARFGLAGVDFLSQRRVPRPAAQLYAAVCRSNEVGCGSAGTG
jgi:beta-glucosidase